jgi:N-hydroxyarylamine O-acetyltransferase
MGSQKITPRTHMLLAVDIAGECYLCDVGFGGEGLLLPIPLRIDQPATQFSWTYRIVTDGPICAKGALALVDNCWWAWREVPR